MSQEIKKTSDKTKDQLIEAATRLFAQKGYAGASVKEIADMAKVNVSLVSYHFGGKENLYKACLESFVKEKNDFFERRILKHTSKEDFRLRLQLFLDEVIQTDLKNQDCSCIITRDIELNDPAVVEIFKNTVLEMFNQFIKFVKSGQDAGYIRSDVNARTVCILLMGGIQHALRTDSLRQKLFGETLRDEKTRDDLVGTAIEMFFNGVDKSSEPSAAQPKGIL